ncbi:hypothetical protein BOTBODRAFT_385040 [Botryobasidium botryosum FD-172 SS1]|uniref:Uncharacterized protein n=1 Tax=Botryobasidium botryosum (strain FD-172 SS1) TaxID=930990 RepID=A0A067MWP8_BOTB1|nr:hypothetical protein BOTBODRAFT_385040 [Botryobasidium botryosum FD-172 SS1]
MPSRLTMSYSAPTFALTLDTTDLDLEFEPGSTARSRGKRPADSSGEGRVPDAIRTEQAFALMREIFKRELGEDYEVWGCAHPRGRQTPDVGTSQLAAKREQERQAKLQRTQEEAARKAAEKEAVEKRKAEGAAEVARRKAEADKKKAEDKAERERLKAEADKKKAEEKASANKKKAEDKAKKEESKKKK